MASPATGEPNQPSDPLQIIPLSHRPTLSKRKKSKPIRFEAIPINVVMPKENQPSPPSSSFKKKKKKSIEVGKSAHLSLSLSLQKEKSTTKALKTPVPISPAMIRAQEVQSRLGNEFPSCIKMMVRSQVICGFWMGLPFHFCKSYLPNDDTLVLEDEMGDQWKVKYIAYKVGISAGWKHFALGHNLVEGDVLIFHLVESAKFKIYIIRANECDEVDGALSLLNLEAQSEQMTPVTPTLKTKRSKDPKSLASTVVQKKQKRSAPSQLSGHRVEHSGNNSEEVGSEVLEGSRPSKSAVSFQEVKCFEDFRIVVNGLCIDRELPDDVRLSYYKLCSYEKQLLHDGLSEGLYNKLVVGMIGETVRVANELKNCKLTTTKEEFVTWDNSLKAFELLGMNVGFLRGKLHAFATFLSESERAVDIKRYVEAKKEQERVENEITEAAAKLKELKGTAKKLEGISGSLQQKTEKYEHEFMEINAPW